MDPRMSHTSEGLAIPARPATSLVIRKYGSWSIAQGIKHGILSESGPNMCGKDEANDGAAWMEACGVVSTSGLEQFPGDLQNGVCQ